MTMLSFRVDESEAAQAHRLSATDQLWTHGEDLARQAQRYISEQLQLVGAMTNESQR
jgi:hypothetical protein